MMARAKQGEMSHYVTVMNVSKRLILGPDSKFVKKDTLPKEHSMVRFEYSNSVDGHAGVIVPNVCISESANRYCSHIMLHESVKLPLVYKDAEKGRVTGEISPREFKAFFDEARKRSKERMKDSNTQSARYDEAEANVPRDGGREFYADDFLDELPF